MKRLEFIKKLAEGMKDDFKLEDIINDELCEIAYEMLFDANDVEILSEEEARNYLEEKGVLTYLSDYQFDCIFDGYLDKCWDAAQDNWG